MHATTTLSLLVSATMWACHLGSSTLGGVQAFLTPAVGPKPFTTGFTTLKPRAAAASPLFAAHTLSSSTSGGPTGAFFHEEKMEVMIGGKMLTFETGKIGRTADGSVTIQQGDTLVYASACAENKPQELDFTPLRIDYFERFSAAGMTSGSYTKRDGRASDREILVARLIDRPLRPMLTEAWTCETQVLSWVFSYDGVHLSEPMAICAASAAVAISSIPMAAPVAGVQVGRVEGKLVINPSRQEMMNSTLNLMVAGTEEGILMIEGAADFLPEEVLVEALKEGQAAIATICRALTEWSAKVGKKKRVDLLAIAPPEIKTMIYEGFAEDIDRALKSGNRNAYSASLHGIEDAIVARYAKEGGKEEGVYLSRDLKVEFKKLVKQRMALMVAAGKGRADGRKSDEVRPIAIEMGILPVPHGSVLFTRGETQALVTVTLGNKGMSQRTENLDGSDQKRFYLQYSFPPSSVGEVGRVGAPGRREVGHGNLAERALIPALPSEEDWPYAMRVESMIMESCGSSSMASACGGSLALMDVGVPLRGHIAGVAMGLLMDEAVEEPIILTDILGLEDAFGTMDFKICGDATGVTTFQLDIKCQGLTFEVLGKALEQAKEGRLHILGVMEKACPSPRKEMRKNVVRINQVKINPSFIGKLIGPQGRQIRAIIDQFSLSELDVSDQGVVSICSTSTESNLAAKKFIEEMNKDDVKASSTVAFEGPMPEVGAVFRDVEIKGIQSFGVFVEILPGLQGLVHVSELNNKRVVSVEALYKSGDRVDVKLLGINEKGQLRLSRKALLEDEGAAGDIKKGGGPARAGRAVVAAAAAAAAGGGGREGGEGGGEGGGTPRSLGPKSSPGGEKAAARTP